jgi:3-oxocholest-4-en-26-oate---CoA ligase
VILKGTKVESSLPRVNSGPKTIVLGDDGKKVAPGEIGWLARGGHVPLGYYKDPEKTATIFREVDGERYVVAGDYARLEDDGTITLLGRGNVSINTGGEKVFPEEVEEAVKLHPSVADCLVVGVPDDRFGEAVTAVVALRQGDDVTGDDIAAALESLARYKRPRSFVFVPEVLRGPNGKADYRWAKETAQKSLAS